MNEEQTVAARMYANQGPLQVRIRTHERYTQPPVDFPAWVVDRVPWRGDEVVLDVGCGSGAYVAPVNARLRRGGWLASVDLSWGMLQDAAANAAANAAAEPYIHPPAFLNADATHLPLADASFDVVLANHILFDVPQLESAVAEFHRVLRPGGRLVAATNARDSMQRFFTEVKMACEALGFPSDLRPAAARVRFTLENGARILKLRFPNVKQVVLESALVFPEAAPAVAYVDSLRLAYAPLLPEGLAWECLMAQVERQIERQIEEAGVYRVAKAAGVFIASRQ